MDARRSAIALVALAFAGGSVALAEPAGKGGQHSADSVGKHGRSPHGGAPPGIANGRLPPPSRVAPSGDRSFVAARERGRVNYRAGGAQGGAPVPLNSDTSLPLGTVLDATRGTVALSVPRPKGSRPQVIVLTGGQFVVDRPAGARRTQIVLAGGDFSVCPAVHPRARRAARAAVATAAAVATSARGRRSRHRVVRRLWARDAHGNFSSYGLTSVATVRGTVWLTEDRCDGTLTRVIRGSVAVYDRVRRHTVVVTAHHSYLARRA